MDEEQVEQVHDQPAEQPYAVYKIYDSGDIELYQQFSSAEERDDWLGKVRESYPHINFKKGNLSGNLEE